MRKGVFKHRPRSGVAPIMHVIALWRRLFLGFVCRPNAAHWLASGSAWGLAPLQARVQPRAHGLGATRTRHSQGATGALQVGTRPPQQAHAGQLRAGRWITGASASIGRHRPGTTTPARAALRAHGPVGARHYLVQAPGSTTHYRRTAVAPLQVAPVGPARAQRRGRALTVQAGHITCPEPRRPPAWHHRPSHCRGQTHRHRANTATSRGQRPPLRRPETAPQGRGLGRGNGATGNPNRAQFPQCAGQTNSGQRFQARTAKKQGGKESVIHKKSE